MKNPFFISIIMNDYVDGNGDCCDADEGNLIN